MQQAFIYDAIRTPRGKAKKDGVLHALHPFDLLKALYVALEERVGLDPAVIAEVILGCVTQVGEQAGNIAKSSALYANWPSTVSGLTVSRFCSSGLDAVALAALKITAGQEQAIVAGGIEMMSRVPMMADQAAIFSDPKLAEASKILLMGSGADLIASLYGCTRADVDAIAMASQQRASAAIAGGYFSSIIPIKHPISGENVTQDECVRPETTMASLGALPASFDSIGRSGADAIQLAAYPRLAAINHVHTAGNSPAMADAAAMVVVGSEAFASTLGAKPRAVIKSIATVADEPLLVLSGCVAATKKLLAKERLKVADIDLFEIHEAFAATMIKLQRDLSIPSEKLNVNGGVIALGHPLGATGAIMLGVLLDELERRQLRTGLVATSGAAGLGTALLIERL